MAIIMAVALLATSIALPQAEAGVLAAAIEVGSDVPLVSDGTSAGIGTENRALAPDISSELSEEEKSNPPKFADTIDVDALAKEAKKVPITTVADLIKEAENENNSTASEKIARDERNSNIGTIGVVNVSNSLNVHTAADGDSDTIGKLYQNTGVKILNYSGKDGEWMYISSGKVCGWVVSKYVMTGAMATSLYNVLDPSVATVVADTTTVYEEADSDSDVMTELLDGNQLPVLGVEGDYVKVQVTSYAVGYIGAFDVSVDKGLATGVPADTDEEVQIDIEVRAETRRLIEEEQAEAEEAARIAKEEAEAAAASRSSSSYTSSGASGSVSSGDGTGWTYLGKFRVTFYSQESCGGNRGTASGVEAQEHYTAATSSQISFGSVVKVDGYGTWVVQDRGVGNNQIDLFVYSSEAYGLYYRDVWIQN